MNASKLDSALMEALAAHGVSAVFDAQGRTGLLAAYMRPMLQGARVAGPAVTVLTPPGDNLAVLKALEMLQPGDVLVLAPSEPCGNAFFGDLMALAARLRGCQALIVDAGVRDVGALRTMGVPAWTKGVSAEGPRQKGPGWVNATIFCAGVRVCAGDIIVADDDGVCVVSQQAAEAVLAAADKRAAFEIEVRGRLQRGEALADILGLRAAVADIAVVDRA